MANIPGPGGGGGGGNTVATGIIAIRADFRQFNTQMNQFNTTIIHKMTSSGTRAGRSWVNAFRRQMRTLSLDMHRLMSGKISQMLTGAAFGGLAFAGWGIKMAGEMEQAEVSMQSLTGSVKKGSEVFKQVRKFALETPFEFPELRDAARLLLAYGVAADDIVPTLKRLGDIAGATGGDIGRIAEVYGRFKTQGRVYAQDIRELTAIGIPIKSVLAKQMGTDTEGITQLVKKGKIGFEEVDLAIRSMTDEGGRFFGQTEKAAVLMTGQLNKMHDAIGFVAAELGEGLRPAVESVTQVMLAMLPHIEKPFRELASEFTPDRIFSWAESAALAVNQVVGAVEFLIAAFAEARGGWLQLMIAIAEKINQANHFFAKMMPGGYDQKQLDASDEFLATLKRESAPYLFDTLAKDKNGAFMMNPDGSFKRKIQAAGEASEGRGNLIKDFFVAARKEYNDLQNKKGGLLADRPVTWKDRAVALKQTAKDVLGAVAGNIGTGLAVAGTGMLARVMGVKELKEKEEKKEKLIDGGFTGFEELNRNIQTALLKDPVQKKIEYNTAETVNLLGGLPVALGKEMAKKSVLSVFIP